MATIAERRPIARRSSSRWSELTWPESHRAIWIGFGAVHAWLVVVGVFLIPRKGFSDLVLYRSWVGLGLHGGAWPVFDGPSVYPVGALVPMIIPAVITTTSTVLYALGWCAMVTALDAVAVQALVRRGGARGAWWWLAFLVLLGPVAMGRIDAIVAPLVIVALLAAAHRPRLAAALITAGAWIKVAPGVLLLPLVMVVRRPVRSVVLPAALVCAGIVGTVAAGGGLRYIASFLSAQDGRGLQVEAVTASPWVLAALVRNDVAIVLNHKLATWEIVGPGTATIARAFDLLLPMAVAGVAWLIWRARARTREVLVWGPLALCTLLIVMNKVGSPQYIGWLAPPVVVALATRMPGPDSAPSGSAPLPRIARTVLAIAALTQVVFPLMYRPLLNGNAVIAVVLVARNVGLVVVLVLACVQLARSRPSRTARVPGACAVHGSSTPRNHRQPERQSERVLTTARRQLADAGHAAQRALPTVAIAPTAISRVAALGREPTI